MSDELFKSLFGNPAESTRTQPTTQQQFQSSAMANTRTPQTQGFRQNQNFEATSRPRNKINDPLHTVFFYNIPYHVSKDEFEHFARQFGEIANLYSIIDTKGQAFTTYFDIRNAQRAVQEVQDYQQWDRKISSNFAFKTPTPNKRDLYPMCASVLVKPDKQSNDILNSEVQEAVAHFGDIMSVNQIGLGLFLVKFYDIRSAKECISNSGKIVTSRGITLTAELKTDDNSNNRQQQHPQNTYSTPQYPYGVPPPGGYAPPGYGFPPPGAPPAAPPPGYSPPQYGAPPGFGAPQYGAPPPQFGTQPQFNPKRNEDRANNPTFNLLSQIIKRN